MIVTTATELPRLMHCMGSRNMPRTIPADYDTEKRDEGNAAHWLAQQLFNGVNVAVGSKAFNGWVITDEMIEHVNRYLGALDLGDMEIETTFGAPGWEVRGRADHIKFRDGVLTIDDFKYGYRPVSPVRNWTLIAHAVGWIVRTGVMPDRIVLRIHQPRAYHSDGPLREWELTQENWWNQINDRLSNPDDALLSSLEHCAKCHAIHNCPAFDRMAWNAMDVQTDVFSDEMPSETLTWVYEKFKYAEKVIELRRESIEELMVYRIKSGQVVPDYALKAREGQRRWKTGLTGAALSLAAGVSLSKDGLVTPAEAERRGVPKSVIAALTERPNIGVKLEKVDHDAIARKVFGDRA